MPLDALIMNFSWELNALFYRMQNGSVFWGHIVWLLLDMVIIFLTYKNMTKKQLIIFSLILSSFIIGLYYLFKLGFMLASVFIIDFIMALSYLLFVKKHKLHPDILSVAICILEFLGDLAAFLYYKSFSDIVLYMGLSVLILHILRMAFFLSYLYSTKKKGQHKH